MAGTFDLHVILNLESGWSTMTSAQFVALFPGLPSDLVTAWYTGLKAENVQFTAAHAPGESDFPTVTVKLTDDRLIEQPLGNYGSLTVAAETWQILVQEEVTIFIFSSSAELTRALYVVARSIMLSSVKWFLKEAGYHSVEFEGGGDIDPDKELFPEDGPVYTRMQRWSALGMAESVAVARPDIQNVLVGAVDSNVTATDKGGVTGSETL